MKQEIIKMLSDFSRGAKDFDWETSLGKAEILFNKVVVRYPSDFLTYYMPVLTYLEKTVVPHKVEVFKAGVELITNKAIGEFVGYKNLPVFLQNLWDHDLSKFSQKEAPYYAYHNFKDPTASIVSPAEFEAAWHHHKVNNPHHPEYWWSVGRDGKTKALPMPPIYQVEMVADWIGAGKTYGSTLEQWLPENLHKFYFHPETAKGVLFILNTIGICARFTSNRKTRLFVPITPLHT